MRRKTIILLLIIVFLIPGLAGAVSEKDFEVQSTENLINLCTAAQDDPLYHQAINFCHGYLLAPTANMRRRIGTGRAQAGLFTGSAAVSKRYDRHVHRVGQGASAIFERESGRDGIQVFDGEMAVQTLIRRRRRSED
jgi:hypothetical protein